MTNAEMTKRDAILTFLTAVLIVGMSSALFFMGYGI